LEENKEKPKIAVIIPCYNEEVTVGKVVKDFKSVLPDSIIYVCDNNSSIMQTIILSSLFLFFYAAPCFRA